MLKQNWSKVLVKKQLSLGRVVAAIKKVEEARRKVSSEVKAEILKHDKQANTILEETGTIDLIKNQVRQGESEEKEPTS